ncbi:MAG: site-specific integrase, partial [Patescibacteria group bacterium]
AVIPIPPLDMNVLVRSFEGYLRVERGRSPITIKRYLSVLSKFVAFIGAGNSDLVLEKVVRNAITKTAQTASAHLPM